MIQHVTERNAWLESQTPEAKAAAELERDNLTK